MAQLPAYHPEPRHTRHAQPRRVSFSVVGAVARLLVNITIIAAIVVGAVLYAHKRTVNARTSQVLSNPPPVFPVFSTGPNDVVVLGCFGRGVERKGKDPYMPGLFYQYSRTFSRADGLYAAGLFCDEVIKDVVVMGTQEDGKVEMVEHTYETFFGSKKVTARAQWDVLGEYDPRCKKGAMKLEFGAGKIFRMITYAETRMAR